MSEYKIYRCDRCGKESDTDFETQKVYLRIVRKNKFDTKNEDVEKFFDVYADKYYDLCEKCSKELMHFLQMNNSSKVGDCNKIEKVSKKSNDLKLKRKNK